MAEIELPGYHVLEKNSIFFREEPEDMINMNGEKIKVFPIIRIRKRDVPLSEEITDYVQMSARDYLEHLNAGIRTPFSDILNTPRGISVVEKIAAGRAEDIDALGKHYAPEGAKNLSYAVLQRLFGDQEAVESLTTAPSDEREARYSYEASGSDTLEVYLALIRGVPLKQDTLEDIMESGDGTSRFFGWKGIAKDFKEVADYGMLLANNLNSKYLVSRLKNSSELYLAKKAEDTLKDYLQHLDAVSLWRFN